MRRLSVVIVCALVMCSSAFADTLTPTDDGMVGRDWWSNPNYYWVDNTSPTIQAYHDGGSRWWLRGLAIFDISSLAGDILEPGSATYNLYGFGFSGVNLQWATVGTSNLTTGYGQIGGANIASLPGSEGWLSYDVTPYLQSSIDAQAHYVGLVFNAVVNYGGGSAASVEDAMGRGSYLQIGSDEVPEPASMILLGLGLGGMIALRRTRKRALR